MALIAFDSRIEGTGLSIQRTVSTLLALPKMLYQWNLGRQTRNALHQLSDKELDDIGLERGDIDIIAHGAMRIS